MLPLVTGVRKAGGLYLVGSTVPEYPRGTGPPGAAHGGLGAGRTSGKEGQVGLSLDVKARRRRSEGGWWWGRRTQEGEEALPPGRPPQFDAGHSLHNANVYPQRPDRAYCAWKDSGVVTLDISDKAHPTIVANINYAPPFPGFTHTVLPLFTRDFLLVTPEAVLPC